MKKFLAIIMIMVLALASFGCSEGHRRPSKTVVIQKRGPVHVHRPQRPRRKKVIRQRGQRRRQQGGQRPVRQQEQRSPRRNK